MWWSNGLNWTFPIWHNLPAVGSGLGIVHCDDQPAVCAKQNVRKTPSVMLYPTGNRALAIPQRWSKIGPAQLQVHSQLGTDFMEKQHLKLMYTFMFIEGEGDFGLRCNHSLSAGYPTEAHTRGHTRRSNPGAARLYRGRCLVRWCAFLYIFGDLKILDIFSHNLNESAWLSPLLGEITLYRYTIPIK